MKTQQQIKSSRGFALIVTLSLMILLTVIAVGLLTLSSISLRATSHSDAMSTARANARMALMLAIGELQKNAGPDQRVTATANLMDPAKPMGVTGVWKSWKPDPTGVSASDYTDRKTKDNFLGYLISNASPTSNPDPTSIPGGGTTEKLVGEGTLGSGVSGEINAPLILNKNGNSTKPQGACAWVAMDEGVKGRVDLEPVREASSLGGKVALMGSPARNRFADVKGLEFLESETDDDLRTDLPKLVSMKQVELKTSSPSDIAGFFHDFTVSSQSLQTNVAEGGLKTDLSVAFDGDYKSSLPGFFNSCYVYSNDAKPFPDSSSNSDILWSMYANYSRLYRLSSASGGDALSGIKAVLPSGYGVKKVRDRTARPYIFRYEPDMETIKEPVLMPTVVGVDMVFSIVTHTAHKFRYTEKYPNQLHLMYLPVITLHNPFNVTLRCKGFKVEFEEVPIGFRFLVNGQYANTDGNLVPLGNLYAGKSTSKAFSVILSTDLNNATEVVMGPGETRIFGTPFESNDSWAAEVAADGNVALGARMFDWGDNLTGNLKMIPGMITGPTDGIGFDVDWLAPSNRAAWLTSRRDDGVILLQPGNKDNIQVEFGPLPRTSGTNSFTITTSMAGKAVGTTIVAYNDQATLTTIMAEGESPRFPERRTFPARFPSTGSPKNTMDLFEPDDREFIDYVNARPFAVFSVGAKTTVDAFTKGRLVADTGIAYQMTTSDFRNTTSQGTSPLEFALVPVQDGSAAIQAGGPNNEMAYFFGGRGSSTGTTAASIYEIPLAPLQSIAQLRNANGASLGGTQLVTYTVGESRAHPAVPANATYKDSSNLDHAWLANSTLWDAYWFSTLSTLQGPAYTGSSSMTQSDLAGRFFDGTQTLPNPRNTPYFPAGKPVAVADAAAAAIDNDGKNSAAYIMTRGGFNVNSTSIPAWTAVLSSLAKSDVPLASGSIESNPNVPFPRVRRPALGAQDASSTNTEKLWNSYRTLTADETKTLATKVVDEVRSRGPFLSMADFVNRRLGDPGELTNKGALQAALDKANLNSIMETNARPISPSDVGSYGWANAEAVTGNTGTGAPGEISQGDVLSAIGSFVTVRSDTFRIRSFGDARDSNGNVIAKAWCEATVQRVPEYLDPADAPEEAAASDTNVNFGRQFEVIAFRWLSANEI